MNPSSEPPAPNPDFYAALQADGVRPHPLTQVTPLKNPTEQDAANTTQDLYD